MVVPTGMLSNSKELPILMGAELPEIISSPTFIFLGAITYLLSPSAYKAKAIWADLFGSYSNLSILAGMLSLFLLKSMIL